jgi:thioesterase domain-containing protein/malonyl CoA-acyl carrier protein transacylase/NAD(P)-dependent dehydrogenase (short-subunit alcohol dehydrogenase family)
MFPGGAAQYPNMGRELYQTEPVYREAVDTCLAHLGPVAAGDLRARLFPAPGEEDAAARALERPSVGLPAIFITEYALARLWQSWGIEPAAMTGHSLGEYACACLAGVMTVQEALSLVVLRGELFERVEAGVMLSVRLPEHALRPLLSGELSLAAVNAPEACVASGLEGPIAALEAVLDSRGAEHSRLKITVPAHSSHLDPVLDEFGRRVASFRLQPPRRPWISNLSGTWITPEQATDPAYWVRHLRQPVRFSDGLQELLRSPDRVFLEVGPGQTLSSLVRAHQGLAGLHPPLAVLASTRHPQAADPDLRTILTALGRLWAAGAPVDWARLHAGRLRQRVPLPSYAFDRQRHWIEPGRPLLAEGAPATPEATLEATVEATGGAPAPALQKLPDLADWFSRPVWREVPLPPVPAADAPGAPGAPRRWLILGAESPLGAAVGQLLNESGRETVGVVAGPAFARLDDRTYALPPDDRVAYEALMTDLTGRGWYPQRVVHLWSTSTGATPLPSADASAGRDAGAELAGLEEAQARGFDSLLALAQALGAEELPQPLHIGVVTDGVQPAGGAPVLHPERATVLGPVRVIPRELPGVTCQAIDVTAGTDPQTLRRLAAQITAEIAVAPAEAAVAYRGETRLVERFEPQSVPAPTGAGPLRRRGVYLITGGLGGIGLLQAEHLARAVQARLILVGRRGLPPREEWGSWLATHTRIDATSRRIRKVQALEALGAEVQIAQADVTNLEAMRQVVHAAQTRFGQIDGVLHAAGVLEDGVLQLKTREAARRVLDPKVRGALVLDALLGQTPLDFFVVFSSTSAILGPAGQVDYAAANAYLNAFAHSRAGRPARVLAVDWGVWKGVGMTAGHAGPAPLGTRSDLPPLDGSPTGNALLGLRAAATGPHGEAIFRSHYRTDELWLLDEHRLADGTAVVPGTGYLEIAAAAANASAGSSRRPVTLSDVFFLSPLAVPDGSPAEVRVSLAPDGDFTISSLSGASWEEHARGTAALLDAPAGAPRPLDLGALAARCTARRTTYEPGAQHTRQEDFVDFGPRWKNLRRVDFGAGEALATLELPQDFAADLDAVVAHPALVDLALHAGLPLVPDYESGADFYVPFSCRRVRLLHPLPRQVYSHVRLADRHVPGGLVAFDVTLADAAGRVLAEVEGFTLKRVAPDALTGAPATPGRGGGRDFLQLALEQGIAPEEGAEALRRALSLPGQPQVVASSIPLEALLGSLEPPAPGTRTPAPPAGEAPLALEASSAPPRNEVERTLAGFWQDLLGLERVGIHDDFFEAGGYSLIAVRLFSRIKKAYGVDLSLATLFEAPTIAACAAVIAEQLGLNLEDEGRRTATPSTPPQFEAGAVRVAGPAPALAIVPPAWSPLVTIRAGDTYPPLFCVHGAGGNVLVFRELVRRLPAGQTVYGLQARGVDGRLNPLTRIEDMASLYVDAIRSVQPSGPYLLSGYSGGGVIAFEMARQLRQQGQETALLAMIDTLCPVVPTRHHDVGERARRLRDRGLVATISSWIERARYLQRNQLKTLRVKTYRRLGRAVPHDLREHWMTTIYLAAQGQYQPAPYAGQVTLFRAQDAGPTARAAGVDLGWGPFVAGGIDVTEVPGDHDSLILEPNVDALAAQLRARLQQAYGLPAGDQARAA